jgi:hypothetical protein
MNTIIRKTKVTLGITILFALVATATNIAQAGVIKQPPIIAKLRQLKQPLSKETKKWMKRWVGADLEGSGFVYDQLSGNTGIYLKISKIDPTDLVNGHKAYGTFVTFHGPSNPDSEIAYFNLAAILGHDNIIRPAIPYTLGKNAAQGFKTLLEKELTVADPASRRPIRINRLLTWLETPPLLGGLKAKKPISSVKYQSFVDTPTGAIYGVPLSSNPIVTALQASNAQPVSGKKVRLQAGYTGDLLQLTREYSIIMTLDALFQQWDRYSNTGNVGLAKDDANIAHFYMTDNGGADMSDDPADVTRNLGYFSRYDRQTIKKLKELYLFLAKPEKGFLGYTNAETFVVDLGLYSEHTPAGYVRLLKRNLLMLLHHVAAVGHKYGNQAYLP